MEERSSIFSARGDGEPIGYIEGNEVFNVSGQRRCRYDRQTGNLRDLRNGEIVGHVSLEGRFVGESWRADKLFRKFDDDIDGAVLQEEAFPNGVGEQPAGQELGPGEDQTPKKPDGDADVLGQMLRELVQDEASPNGVGEQPAGQELAPGEDQTPKNPDGDADVLGQILRELVQDEASPNGVGEQPAGQEPAPGEDQTPKNPDGHALHPLRQVLAVANEVFGQRAAEDDEGVLNVGERSNPLSELAEPAISTNSAGEWSGPSEEAERIFEMLRNRIGLSAEGLRNVEEKPNPLSEREGPNIPTSFAGEQSGAFPREVERVFEMLRDRIALNAQHPHTAGETPNPQSERGEAAGPTITPAEQSVPFSQEVGRVFEILRDKELD
jgi:hypothetical protein